VLGVGGQVEPKGTEEGKRTIIQACKNEEKKTK
jgi:hypothetical protein